MIDYQDKIIKNIKTLVEIGDIYNAKSLLTEYEKMNLYNKELDSIKAIIYIKEKKYDEAIVFIRNVIQTKLVYDKDLLYNLAFVYSLKNEYELSLEYYKIYLDINKDNQNVIDSINVIKSKLDINYSIIKEIKLEEYIIKLLSNKNYNDIIKICNLYLKERKFELLYCICIYSIKNSNTSMPIIYYFLGCSCNGLKFFDNAKKYHHISILLDYRIGNIVEENIAKRFYHYNDIKIKCIGCDSDQYNIINVSNQSISESNKGIINPIRIWCQCQKCGLIYANPIPSIQSMNNYYSIIAKEKFGGIYGNIRDREEFLFSMANDRLNKINLYIKNGRVLDIGTGIGIFVKAARDRGIDAYGLELTKEDCEYAKINYGLDLIKMDFYDFHKDDLYDVVTLFEVIEHLRHPQKDLIRLNKLVKRNGILVVATPIQDSSYGNKTKENNVFWNVVSHLSYFTKGVLVNYLKRAGFEVLDIKDSFEGMGRMEFYCKKIIEI